LEELIMKYGMSSLKQMAALAIVTSVMLVPAVSASAEQVTVMLRSGEKVAGQLEDHAHDTIYVRVSQDDQRKLPIGQVAVIDFVGGASGLPETELSHARGDEHLMVLRNSQLVKGRLVDIEGGKASSEPDKPRVFIFRTAEGEERRVPVDEVGRVYVGRYPQAAPAGEPTAAATGTTDPATAAQAPSREVPVAATRQWAPTGIMVTRGQELRFDAQGEVQLSNDANDRATPAGSLLGRNAPRAPMPRQLAGALIGRVGNGAPFGIGDQTGPIVMPASGQLFLGVNDDTLGDNLGEFKVTITLTPAATATRRR